MRSQKPKVLQTIACRSMLAHVLETGRKLNPAAIHIVYGHAGAQVQAAFADQPNLNWVEQKQQLGTGHAVLQAIPNIPDQATLLVMYGDVPLVRESSLQKLITASADSLAVLVDELENPTGYGRVVVDDGGRVQSIVEQKDATSEQRNIRIVNTGMIAASARKMRDWLSRIENKNAQAEYYLTDVFALATQDQAPAAIVRCSEQFECEGANDAWQLAQLERRYQLRQVQQLCADGARVIDPLRIDIRGQVRVGQDVEIDANVIFEGNVELGDDVRIGAFCQLRDVRLGKGTIVKSHSHLDGVKTLGACVIGPFARLRPGTELDEGVHIGNFVETKKSKLGKGSKANHLSYLGDAQIGSKVNIGAGTITCNYDGVNKFVTKIEDGVFVGSNSSLVAPLTIGVNATIGAGSVITKTAKENALTLSRPKQITIEDWQRPTKK